MQREKTINIPGAGIAVLHRSKRARRISISVKTSGEVRVTIPLGGTISQAEDFLFEKTDWVLLQRHKADILSQRHQEIAKACRTISSEKEAKTLILERVYHLAGKNGFSFNKVSVKNQKTRWGSCSFDNNISINAKIARLPGQLLDFVILHELVHTGIKNHSGKFWSELAKYVEDVHTLRRELRNYRLDLL